MQQSRRDAGAANSSSGKHRGNGAQLKLAATRIKCRSTARTECGRKGLRRFGNRSRKQDFFRRDYGPMDPLRWYRPPSWKRCRTMLCTSRKPMTAKTTTISKFPIPKRGGFGSPSAGVFESSFMRTTSSPDSKNHELLLVNHGCGENSVMHASRLSQSPRLFSRLRINFR